ncbi:efflux RND transporter periplasmic adaptor subunit [Nostoc sp. 'Peltigera malacea cyanobiont' DB3992]|uniref:efflux RND transporter periplasmic adaptor subunit n=1 Tax=Nostoc sp. 'Peltigera malacea cyanobiont' DB3992 TaxID=1206980 RepID=UPI000C039800|nr:efflux RND transporter periplasmic adaptor subunit [Nostoc sp. 'Peltigera malacea cyanobiont' DB3992]PHM10489.1 efflux transporter periplasmic adaptor subunit [Nostoc sp. 'Peltigera malacea cyanobiont' DB3992]
MSDESLSEVEVEEAITSEDRNFLSKSDQKQTKAWLKPLFLGTGLGIAIALVGMSVLNRFPSREQSAVADKKVNPAMTVTIATVETARVVRTLKTTGTVAASDLIPVLPQTNGLQIKSIPVNVKEGAFVKQGQVLAVLDGSIVQSQISQAKADVESKQADVASKQADVASKQADLLSNKAIVQQKQADLAQAKARLEEAAKNYQRYQQLADSGTISKQELDTRSYNVKTAIEVVNLSQENIRSAQANIGSAQANINNAQAIVNKAKADVKSSAAKVQQLQTQLGQTVVRAPVSGVIAEKLARVGDVTGVPPQTQVGTVIGGTQKLFSIIRDEKLELQAKVPETQLTHVKIGASVQITSDVDRRVRSQGRVRDIQPQVNDQRREATVKIDLPPTTLLKPGMFASAAITTNSGMKMVVPQKAVQSQTDASVIVFILSGENTVRSQKVELGDPGNNDTVEIKSGLQLGDRVVVDGAGYLKDGDLVRVAN